MQVDGRVWYRYQVRLDGDSFVAVAEGDLDGDGAPSRFTLSGRDLQVAVRDELE